MVTYSDSIAGSIAMSILLVGVLGIGRAGCCGCCYCGNSTYQGL